MVLPLIHFWCALKLIMYSLIHHNRALAAHAANVPTGPKTGHNKIMPNSSVSRLYPS